MTRDDNAIAHELDQCGDDAQSITSSAVRIILQSDDLNSLQQDTRDRLFLGLAASGHDLRLQTCDTQEPDPFLEVYKAAYHKIIPFYDYAEKLKQRIAVSAEKTFGAAHYQGDFQSATLFEKAHYANGLVCDFLDDFDPDCLLHKKDEDKKLWHVGLKTQPLPKTWKQSLPIASFNLEADKIYLRRYFLAWDNIDPNDGNIDFLATEWLFEEGDFSADRMQFDIDRCDGNGYSHHQYNQQTPDIRYATFICDELALKKVMAHEATHMALALCTKKYEEDQELTAHAFDYGFSDYAIFLVGHVAYDQAINNRENYLNNKEEIFARSIEECVTDKSQQKLQAA